MSVAPVAPPTSSTDRVHALAAAAAQLGLTVNEVRTAAPAIQLRAGIRGVSATEMRAVRKRLDWLTARAGGSSERCRSCQAPVLWGATEKGKSMPVDPLPHPRGNITLVGTAAGGYLITVHPRHALPLVPPAYRSHFATCPSAGAIRERMATREPAPSDQDVLCAVCGYRLDPWLVAAGHTTHLEDLP